MLENFQASQEPSFVEEVKPMPFIDKLTGVFTAPAEVFENLVKSKPKTVDWLAPVVILIVLAILSNFLKFSNERIKDSLIAFQEQRIDKLVEEGKMTEEQAEMAKEGMEVSSGMQQIFSVIGVLIGIPILFLIVTLVYFLLGKLFLKGNVDFMTIFSIYSLSSLIGSVGVIVATILAFVTGSFFASASPAIFMEASSNKAYMLASKIEIFTLWQLAVFAIGMAKAFNKDYLSAFAVVFGAWAVWVVLSLFIPFLGG
ncbi:Yip1 domain-containing protein [Candidatus Kryptonium thompsonii]|uniref:Yip1 domain-containing protein n=1 Tax=Candidatus Kryptonium thompsonii TaxID=1633631 RepID=A0A0P1L5X3_9BACT|nr:YIP1 family protein [Candidatus Kryptonium thompsoni]CUS76352.1 Yip1 domain-containing protein [Candidatus Kryptonium thompsoni]CUS79507.1 Yip1 domain-containing protein [Candidatus Kryptonium thompsoni]CUS83020.1 Yip1 domain-containing protein [Candidatus Kryptonium thompsoni]CUS93936.1 Yip1 domain-containing protein [Candidatus Kryptonium thompsoni]CUS94830.1 Yip1 domain-containing protein [Candidatus Kryptonium thompsoni]